VAHDSKPMFAAPSSINNTPTPTGAAGWLLVLALVLATFGGTALIHVAVRSHMAAIAATVILWCIACGAFAVIAYRRASLPSRGR
jgi:hypothetical protein